MAKVEPFSNLAESIRKKEIDGHILLLNGIATHRRFIFNIYRVSLYVSTPTQNSTSIIESEGLKYAEMQFMRDLEAKDIQEAFAETFKENCLDDCETLKPDIAKLLAAIPNMNEGAKIDFFFYPQESIIKGFNNQSIRFEGPNFGRFFLRAWLGDNPPSRRFKNELLNINPLSSWPTSY